MELIDRYLQAVRFWLPKNQSDDIIAELSEELCSQVDEGERENGRKLNDSEIVAVLKGLGPPLTVASRYLPQRSLIGPVSFPVYVFVVKIVFVGCVAPQVLALIQLWLAGAGAPGESWFFALGRAVSSIWLSLLSSFGLVTAIFAVIERVSARNKSRNDWDPRQLPPVRDPLGIPRSSSIFDLVFSVLILAWWAGKLRFQTDFDVFGTRVILNPSWGYFVGGLVFVMLGQAALGGVNLIRPRWTRARAAFRLAIDCVGGVLFCWLLRAGVLREVVEAGASKGKTAGMVDALNVGISNTLPMAVLVCVIIVLVDVRRFFRASKMPVGGE